MTCFQSFFLYGSYIFPYILVCLLVLYASLVRRNQLLQKETKELIDDDSKIKDIFCTYVCLAEASGDHFIVIGLEMSYDILMEFTAGPKN